MDELVVFQGKLLNEPTEYFNVHSIGIELQRLKASLRNNPHQLKDYLDAINRHIRNSFPKTPSNHFIQIEVTDLNITTPVKLDYLEYKICPVFTNCIFERFEKSMATPIIFKNCEIRDVFINSSALSDSFFKDSNIRHINLHTQFSSFTIHGGEVECLEIAQKTNPNSFVIRNCRIKEFIGENIIFKDAIFENVKFEMAPIFINSKFSNTVSFNNCEFFEFNKAALSYYREMKKIFLENHNEHSAIEFSSYEQKSKFYILDKETNKFSNLDWWVSYSYNQINDFGLKTYRPLKWIGLITIFSFIAFDLMGYFNLLYDLKRIGDNDLAHSLSLAILVGLGPLGIFGKISEVYPTTLAGQLIHLLFNLITSLLWFFLIIGIRKRYKLS